MAFIVVHSVWKELKKDAAFIGLGFALGCYCTYKYLDKITEPNHTQYSQPYGLEKKVTE